MIDGNMVNLSAGLSAQAEIRTGQRRVIEFLLSPLAKRVDEAGRER
jgi:hemolysin D